MSKLQTFLSTHEYSEKFSILFEDEYVRQLETHMNLNNQITLIWGGPLIYQLAYTGFCELKDYLYSSNISHNCFTKVKYNNMNNISCNLKPLSSSLVNLENYYNNTKLSSGLMKEYDQIKYEVTMKAINEQKSKFVTFNNLTIHLLSISDSNFYVDQILEYKYHNKILKAHPEQKLLENEVIKYYDIKFNNKPSFSILQSASADIMPTPAPPGPGPGPSPGPGPGPGPGSGPIYTGSRPRLVTYVDTRGINWSTPPLVPVKSTEYTDVLLSFFTPSTNAAVDIASTVLDPTPAGAGAAWLKYMRSRNPNQRIILSVCGATETPPSAAYFTTNEPVALAKTIADQIKRVGLDGVDLDWEDNEWSHGAGCNGLTGYPGSTRGIGKGPGTQWVITLTKELRKNLPRPRYTISHAPQSPYFEIGYQTIWNECGTDIDWINTQFYNQGAGQYTDKTTLVDSNNHLVCNSCPGNIPSNWDGSIADLVKKGVPSYKIVVGKPITSGDGNQGIPKNELPGVLKYAVSKFPELAGAMGWQFGSDVNGSWIEALKPSFKTKSAPPPGPAPPTPPTPPPTPPPPTPKPTCPCPGCTHCCLPGPPFPRSCNTNASWNATSCHGPWGDWCGGNAGEDS